MRIILLLFCTFLIAKCSNNIETQKKKIDGYIVESSFKEDSIFDGITNTFNLDGKLISSFYYSNGYKNGFGKTFYSNGRIYDSSNYTNGLINGSYFMYDSFGNLIYKNYHFYGQKMGDELFFKERDISEFVFLSFEKKILFNCAYDSLGIKGASGNILNINSYAVNLGKQKKQGIFVYLIYPPKVFVKYSLGIFNKETNEKKEILNIRSERRFFDTTMPLLEEKYKYYVSAFYADTLNNFKRIYISTIEN